jgi:hypothetical protein
LPPLPCYQTLNADIQPCLLSTLPACVQELAATTPGFVNASVEFDVASLRPTYRLLWGAAGESNALAVAQGLGFAPTLVATAREASPRLLLPGRRCAALPSVMLQLPPQARFCQARFRPLCLWLSAPVVALQVAAQLHHSSQQSGQRSLKLHESLLEQLEEARLAASEAAAARAAAEAAASSAQKELEAAQQQQTSLGKAAGEAKNAGPAAQQRVQAVLKDVRAGRLTVREAEEALREMEREVAPPGDSAVRLMGLRAAGQVRGAHCVCVCGRAG